MYKQDSAVAFPPTSAQLLLGLVFEESPDLLWAGRSGPLQPYRKVTYHEKAFPAQVQVSTPEQQHTHMNICSPTTHSSTFAEKGTRLLGLETEPQGRKGPADNGSCLGLETKGVALYHPSEFPGRRGMVGGIL